MKVFLSYSPDDAGSAIAPTVGRMLAERGFDVWDPSVEVLPGDNGAKAMGAALEGSDAIIVLLTDHYMSSSWSFQDLSFALGNERYRDKVVFITVDGEGAIPPSEAWLPRIPRIAWDRRNPRRVVESVEHSLKVAA